MYSRKIAALKEEHHALEKQLEDIAHITDEEAKELKKEKLRVKDLIEFYSKKDALEEAKK